MYVCFTASTAEPIFTNFATEVLMGQGHGLFFIPEVHSILEIAINEFYADEVASNC